MREPGTPRAQQDELAQVPRGPELPAGHDETEPGHEGDHARHDRPVQSRPRRDRALPEGFVLFRRGSELQARASTVTVRREGLRQSWTRRPRPDAEPTRAMPDYPVRVIGRGE